MPKGVPDRCNKPSSSPILPGWSPQASTTTTTTTVDPSVDSGVSVPPSGNACVGDGVLVTTTLPPIGDECKAYRIVTGRLNLRNAIIQITQCATLNITTIALAPNTCTIVYSLSYPIILDDGYDGSDNSDNNSGGDDDDDDGDGNPDTGVEIDPEGCTPPEPQDPLEPQPEDPSIPDGSGSPTPPYPYPSPSGDFLRVYTYGGGNVQDSRILNTIGQQQESTFRPSTVFVNNSNGQTIANEWVYDKEFRSIFIDGEYNYQNARNPIASVSPNKFTYEITDEAPIDGLEIVIDNFNNDQNFGNPSYVLTHHYGNSGIINDILLIPSQFRIRSNTSGQDYSLTYYPSIRTGRQTRTVTVRDVSKGLGDLWALIPSDKITVIDRCSKKVADLYSWHPESGYIGDRWAYTEQGECPDRKYYWFQAQTLEHVLIPIEFDGSDLTEESKQRIRANDKFPRRDVAGYDLPSFTADQVSVIKSSGDRHFLEVAYAISQSEMRSSEPCGAKEVQSGASGIPPEWGTGYVQISRDIIGIDTGSQLGGKLYGNLLQYSTLPYGQFRVTKSKYIRIPNLFTCDNEGQLPADQYTLYPAPYDSSDSYYTYIIWPNEHPSGLPFYPLDQCSTEPRAYYTETGIGGSSVVASGDVQALPEFSTLSSKLLNIQGG